MVDPERLSNEPVVFETSSQARSVTQGDAKVSPKGKTHTTLLAFLIDVLAKHGSPMEVEELVPLFLANYHTLRRRDGRKYTCKNPTRTITSALSPNPVFNKTLQGWVLNDTEAQLYKNNTLKKINHRLGKLKTLRFDADQACSLLTRRVKIEGNEMLLSLIKASANLAMAKEKRKECIGRKLVGLRTGDSLVAALARRRVAGMCVMFHLLRNSKAMTQTYLLPDQETYRRKISNLSLNELYIENKLASEISALAE